VNQTTTLSYRRDYAPGPGEGLRLPHYWIVRMARNDGPAISVERFRLSTSGEYVFEGIAVRGRDLRAMDTMDPLLA
jgi:hypothetical protein